ncbi:MAG: hypothetical protein R6X33_05265 [Candidatus Brocadiia bacterium]
MISREEIENLLAEVRRRRTEAEAEAGHAAERLARLVSGMTPLAKRARRSAARLVSGMTPLEEVDTEQVRATADTYAGAVERLAQCTAFARDLRRLLI